MRVALTGTTGFVGKHVLAACQARGVTPVILSRAVLAESDTDIRHKLSDCDAVIHLAGRAHRFGSKAFEKEEFWRDNVTLTERLASLAAQAGCGRFILMSTIGVHGKRPVQQPVSVNTPLVLDTVYAASKQAAEEAVATICEQSGMNAVMVRAPLVYGPNAPGNIGKLQKLIRLGVPLPFKNIRNKRDMVHVDRLAGIVLDLLRDPTPPMVYYPADPAPLSTPELLQFLANESGQKVRLFPFPQKLLQLMVRLAGRGDSLAPLWDNYRLTRS